MDVACVYAATNKEGRCQKLQKDSAIEPAVDRERGCTCVCTHGGDHEEGRSAIDQGYTYILLTRDPASQKVSVLAGVNSREELSSKKI
jgi:hypothetical protein